MRRILALLLCVLLLLPMLPISGVQAAEPDAVEALWTRILAAEDEQAVFLDMLEEEQSELKELRNRLI